MRERNYESPKLEIVLMDSLEIVRTSGGLNDGGTGTGGTGGLPISF